MPSMQRENTTIGHLDNKNEIPLFIIQSALKCVSFEFSADISLKTIIFG